MSSRFDDFLVTNDDDVDYDSKLYHQILLADCDLLVFEEAVRKEVEEAMDLEIEAIKKNKS